jgi:two-component sensor histidine kinase
VKPYWYRSVGARFTLFTFFLVVAISGLFVVIDGYCSFLRERARLTENLKQIDESHVPSIVSSLWLTDYELLGRQLEAIERFDYVDRVEVVTVDGAVYAAGTTRVSGLEERSRDLVYTRRDRKIEIGRLNIFTNHEAMRAAALRAEILSASGHLLMAFVTAGVVALLFQKQIGRHLADLALQLESVKRPENATPFRLTRPRKRKDELHFLVEATNSMRESLSAHVEARELLMREVHHRIKNDLTFVRSLLTLQAGQSENPETVSALEEAGLRVGVMGEIYERLHTDSNFTEVELPPLVREIVTDLQSKGALSGASVDLSVEETCVPVQMSVGFGIILNELLTNAAKYAGGASGTLRVTVDVSQDASNGSVDMTVRDNGPGLPEAVCSGGSVGFGLSVVDALVRQHKGTLSLGNDQGAVITVSLRE